MFTMIILCRADVHSLSSDAGFEHAKLQDAQKLNHFPRHWELTRKYFQHLFWTQILLIILQISPHAACVSIATLLNLLHVASSSATKFSTTHLRTSKPS